MSSGTDVHSGQHIVVFLGLLAKRSAKQHQAIWLMFVCHVVHVVVVSKSRGMYRNIIEYQ